MRKSMLLLVGAVFIISLSPTLLRAATIAVWTLESLGAASLSTPGQVPGSYSPETGAGSFTAFHDNAVTGWTLGAGNGSGRSLTSNNWTVGDYFQFQVATTGQSGIVLDWDHASSATGPRDFALMYSTDGSSFTQFGSTNTVISTGSPNTPWNATTYQSLYHFSRDLSSISAIDNQAAVIFRLVLTSANGAASGTITATASSRIDNISVTTAPIPEPSAIVIGMIGVFAVLIGRTSCHRMSFKSSPLA